MDNNISAIIDYLRSRNPKIGEYVSHTVAKDVFDYAVKLSNGRIIVKGEAVQDYPNFLPSTVVEMLSTFIAN